MDEAARCWATSTSIEGGSCTAISAAGRIGFPTANLCTENELLPPHGVYATNATIDGIVHAVGHQHRDAADRRRVRPDVHRDAHFRPRSGSVRGRGARSLRSAAARRAGVRVAGPAEIPDRRRLRARPRAVRSPFTVESPFVAAQDDFAFALTLPGHAHDTEMLVELLRTVLGHAGFAGDTLERLIRQVGSVRARGVRAAAVQRAVRGHAGELRIVVSQAGRDWRTTSRTGTLALAL